MSDYDLKTQISDWAGELGLSKVAFASLTEPPGSRDKLLAWIDRGNHAGMAWMARDPVRRVDPSRILEGGRSVIAVALVYLPDAPVPAEPGLPKIARYAHGEDYHEVLGEKLHALRAKILQLRPATKTRIACDTSPIHDRAFAESAGLGWVGKNTCLIDRELGSWFFIGLLFTDLELPPDPTVADFCGSCTRCIDACPTDAIVAPYQLDANLCISYWNIEHRGEMDPSWPDQMGEWLVGCDICQEVCPWNRKAPVTSEPRFAPSPNLVRKSAEEWGALSDEEYRATIRGTAVSRIKPPDMRRNARIVGANGSRDEDRMPEAGRDVEE